MPETTSDSPAAPTIDGTTSAAASATNAPTASAASPTPTFAGLRQVSDGWIKKYVLTYTMPDGSTYEYESASRKGPRGVPRRAGRRTRAGRERARPTPCASCRRRADGRAAAHPRVPLSAEQLVHRVPGRARGAGRGPRNLPSTANCARRRATPCAPTLAPTRPRSTRCRKRAYSSTGLTDETVHVVFAQVEKRGRRAA